MVTWIPSANFFQVSSPQHLLAQWKLKPSRWPLKPRNHRSSFKGEGVQGWQLISPYRSVWGRCPARHRWRSSSPRSSRPPGLEGPVERWSTSSANQEETNTHTPSIVGKCETRSQRDPEAVRYVISNTLFIWCWETGPEKPLLLRAVDSPGRSSAGCRWGYRRCPGPTL